MLASASFLTRLILRTRSSPMGHPAAVQWSQDSAPYRAPYQRQPQRLSGVGVSEFVARIVRHSTTPSSTGSQRCVYESGSPFTYARLVSDAEVVAEALSVDGNDMSGCRVAFLTANSYEC